jgi:hypothetical protein
MQYIFASRISGVPITSRGGSPIDREDQLEMAAEKITDLAEFLKVNANITQPDVSFRTILAALMRQFMGVLSTREIAYLLCSFGSQILLCGSDEDRQNGEMYPREPRAAVKGSLKSYQQGGIKVYHRV